MNRVGSRVMALLLTMVVAAGPLAVAPQAEQTAPESEEAWQTAAAPGLSDEQDLFAEYVQRVFYGDQGVAPLAEHGEDIFTGTGLSLYRQLKEFVASVANGEQSSTLFKTTLRWEDLPQTQWTAQDLGVDSIEMSSGATNPDALQAVYDIIGYDPETLTDIVDCLLVDCPYDLYWFDKTGYSYSPGVNYSKEEINGETMLVLQPTIAQVSFTVSKNYAPADAADKFTIDTSKTGAAISAAANARQIV